MAVSVKSSISFWLELASSLKTAIIVPLQELGIEVHVCNPNRKITGLRPGTDSQVGDVVNSKSP